MHAKIEKLLSMLKAQEHKSSETVDSIKKLIQELLKESPKQSSGSTWITK
jgi:hypothetical protein